MLRGILAEFLLSAAQNLSNFDMEHGEGAATAPPQITPEPDQMKTS
jgi:hypothetical protein